MRKEDQQPMNHDDGSYRLGHMYDGLLAMSQLYRGKNRKKNWINFFWWRSLTEIKTSKVD